MSLPDFEHSNDMAIGWYQGGANSFTDEGSISTINGTSGYSYDFHSRYSLSGSIGAKFYDAFRVEFEIGYTKGDFDVDFDVDFPERPPIVAEGEHPNYDTAINNQIDWHSHLEGEISTWTFLCNSYYDFKISKNINPFIGVGLGLAGARIRFSNIEYVYGDSQTIDETAFAYQLMAGISCALDEKTNIDIKYRYLDIAAADFLDPHFEFNYQGIMIGLRRYF